MPSSGSHNSPPTHWHHSLNSPVFELHPQPRRWNPPGSASLQEVPHPGCWLWQLQPPPSSRAKPHQLIQAPEVTAPVGKPSLHPSSFVHLSVLSTFGHTDSWPLIFLLLDFNSLHYLYVLEDHRIECIESAQSVLSQIQYIVFTIFLSS